MNLSRIQQENRPCRKNVIASPAIGAHRSPIDNTVYQLLSYRTEHWNFSFRVVIAVFRRTPRQG
jgi:hypothetical protein